MILGKSCGWCFGVLFGRFGVWYGEVFVIVFFSRSFLFLVCCRGLGLGLFGECWIPVSFS